MELEVKLDGQALVRGNEEDEVGRDGAEGGVLAVGEGDGEGVAVDGTDVLRAGMLACRAVCCAGGGGGERGQATDADGGGLECGCGVAAVGGLVIGWDLDSCCLRPRTPRKC